MSIDTALNSYRYYSTVSNYIYYYEYRYLFQDTNVYLILLSLLLKKEINFVKN